MQLGFTAGTVPVEKLAPFERLLFRSTRGNMFLKFTPVRRGGEGRGEVVGGRKAGRVC